MWANTRRYGSIKAQAAVLANLVCCAGWLEASLPLQMALTSPTADSQYGRYLLEHSRELLGFFVN